MNSNKRRVRLLELEYCDPYMNFALEEALLLTLSKDKDYVGTFRLWRNLVGTIVIGRFQSVNMEVNRAACEKYGIRVVRRFTGGGTVYTDSNCLNFTIVSSFKILPFNKMRHKVFAIYKLSAEIVVKALKKFGVQSHFEPPANIITKDLKKISGLALGIRGGSFLCHGSLLIDTNLRILNEALNPPINTVDQGRQVKYVRSIRREVTNLKELTKKPVSLDQVKLAFKIAFEEVTGLKLVNGKIRSYETKILRQLYQAKYSNKIFHETL